MLTGRFAPVALLKMSAAELVLSKASVVDCYYTTRRPAVLAELCKSTVDVAGRHAEQA